MYRLLLKIVGIVCVIFMGSTLGGYATPYKDKGYEARTCDLERLLLIIILLIL